MELSKLDRLILANQHSILEKLDEQNAAHHAQMRDIYENGYAMHYSSDFERIYDEFPKEEARLVIDVLDMYSALQRSRAKLGNPEAIEEHKVQFPGFDGNNETSYMAYARFFVEDLGRFTDLNIFDFNGHMRSVPEYRRMVEVWKSKGNSERYHLSEQDMNDILEARRAG